jgi:hypothetical protein
MWHRFNGLKGWCAMGASKREKAALVIAWKHYVFAAVPPKKAIGRRLVDAYKKGRITATTYQRARNHVEFRACCTPAWGELVWNYGEAYPGPVDDRPGASHRLHCRKCKAAYPQNYVRAGICEDCRACGEVMFEVDGGVVVPAGISSSPSSTSITTIYQHHHSDRARIRGQRH